MTDRCESYMEAPGSNIYAPEKSECIHARGHSGLHHGYFGISGLVPWEKTTQKIYPQEDIVLLPVRTALPRKKPLTLRIKQRFHNLKARFRTQRSYDRWMEDNIL